uniref:DUF423 domain-containing protein n=1 Tax=Schlesneria paludicola TaxID=360056 RepID=A0A7C4LMS0_9PLAN
MHRLWGTLGALFGGLAVMLGAFAAHRLDRQFAEQYAGQTRIVAGETIPLAAKFLRDFRTAAEYQMYHALALLAVAALAAQRPSRLLTAAGGAFTAGIVLFSGSLYILTTTGVTSWGAVTPFGGVAFVIGWLALAAATLRKA